MIRKFDFLVIGSGIAGMSFALKVAHKGSVALICKAGLEEANTYFAQGGIASVTNLKLDKRPCRRRKSGAQRSRTNRTINPMGCKLR